MIGPFLGDLDITSNLIFLLLFLFLSGLTSAEAMAARLVMRMIASIDEVVFSIIKFFVFSH
jgi:hypothetical protein